MIVKSNIEIYKFHVASPDIFMNCDHYYNILYHRIDMENSFYLMSR